MPDRHLEPELGNRQCLVDCPAGTLQMRCSGGLLLPGAPPRRPGARTSQTGRAARFSARGPARRARPRPREGSKTGGRRQLGLLVRNLSRLVESVPSREQRRITRAAGRRN